MSCANLEWVPYDLNISPVDNLFDLPDNLDPQPEYPLRKNMVFFKEEERKPRPNLEMLAGDVSGLEKELIPIEVGHLPDSLPTSVDSMYPPVTLLFVLWVFGLLAWCALFMEVQFSGTSKTPRKNKKKASSYKEV
jgi:hypothetical protein